MALQTSGPISLNNVNQELGNAAPYTQVISLNDTAVRTLFAIASGAIRMSDGYGKSSIPPYQFINGTGGGGDEYVCGNDGTWGTVIQIAGTLPITWQLLMYANGCTGEHVLQTGSSGGAGYNPIYTFVPNNAAASGSGTYTGGSIKYKAAHYKVKVFDSGGSLVLTTPAYHVNYGNCSTVCNGTESCVPRCCAVDCSGDCNFAPDCRAECSEADFQYCAENFCLCQPQACGEVCQCEPFGYEDVYESTNYAPHGTCN